MVIHEDVKVVFGRVFPVVEGGLFFQRVSYAGYPRFFFDASQAWPLA